MAKDVDIEIGVSGAQQTKRALTETGQAVRGVGDETERTGKKARKGGAAVETAGKKIGTVGRLADAAKAQVAGFFAGLLSTAMVIRGLDALIERLEKIRDMQREIAGESLTIREATFELSKQLGDTSQKGQRRAEAIALDMQRGGAFQDIQTAVQYAISADINLPGGLAQSKGLAMSLAPFAGAVGDPQAAGALLETLNIFGRTGSKEEAQAAASKILKAQQESGFGKLGEFLMALRAGTSQVPGMGGELEDALQLLVQARATGLEGMRAGTLAEQVLRISQGTDERSRKFLRGEATKRGLEFGGMTGMEKLGLFEEIIRGAQTEQEKAKIRGIFPAEVIGRAFTVFSDENRAKGEALRAKLQTLGPEEGVRFGANYVQTQLGRSRIAEAERAARRVGLGRDLFDVTQLRKLAKEIYEERQARGEVPYLRTARAVQQQIMAEELVKQLPPDVAEALREAARRPGDSVTGERVLPESLRGLDAKQRRAALILAELLSGRPVGISPEDVRQVVETVPTITIGAPGEGGEPATTQPATTQPTTTQPAAPPPVSANFSEDAFEGGMTEALAFGAAARGPQTVNYFNYGTIINDTPNTRDRQLVGASNFESFV